MSKSKNFLFIFLLVITWIIFVGLCIEAFGLLVNFIVSLTKPELVPRLYQTLDLSELHQANRFIYYGVYSFILVISFMKAYMFYIVIDLMHKLDLSKPFNNFVAKQISRISYYTIAIGLLSYAGRKFAIKVMQYDLFVGNLDQFWPDSEAFIIMGAVIYIIATIFKKGVEIQNENDLTV